MLHRPLTGATRERGMVTAELAVAIPAVALVLVICLGGLMAALDQIRCVDAAHAAGRAAARGDSLSAIRSLAVQGGPTGATVTIDRDSDQARVTVSARVGGWGGFVPSWRVSASAVTPLERGVSQS